MLALDRPLGVVADLALFGDHADKRRVFYVPTRPKLARVASGAELAFVKFRRSDQVENGGVGFLSFTSELAASDQQLKEAREHLERSGISEPFLVQPPWTGGKAVLAAALKEGDGFVERMLGEVTPDLAATNRATFSVMLSEQGARLVETLLSADEGPSPLGVRYELEYQGLRPALDVHIRADYSRIYRELSFGFQFGVAYEGIGVRATVESATKKLRESGAIEVEVLHFTDDADLKSRVDEAVRWLQDKIIEDFFKTTLQPPIHQSLLSQAIDAAKALGASTLQQALADTGIAGQIAQQLGLSNDALTKLAGQGAAAGAGAAGGAGGAGGAATDSTFALKLQFTYRDIKEEELKTIVIDWSEARAERRTAAPQGLLSQIGPLPEVVEVEDSGTFWARLQVKVRPLGDFASLGVERLVVQLAYPDEERPTDQKAFAFEPGDVEPQQFASWTNGKAPVYRVRTSVHFRDEGPWPGAAVFEGAWHSSQSLDLAVHPLSEIPRFEIELSAGTLNFEETPQVRVDLRLDENVIATRTVTDAEPNSVFRYRPSPEQQQTPELSFRPTWFLAGGGKVEGEWTAVEGTAVLLGRPWRNERSIRVFPLLPDDFIDAFVTLTMTDGDHTQTAEVRFEAGERRAKVVKLPALSATLPPVRVDVLVIRGDGSTFVKTPYETSEPVVMVRDREGEHRQISVKLLSGPDLTSHGLMAVQVHLLDANDENVDSVVFTQSQRNPGLLLAPVAGPRATKVRYRVVRYTLDGTALNSDVLETTASELLIPAVAQAPAEA